MFCFLFYVLNKKKYKIKKHRLKQKKLKNKK